MYVSTIERHTMELSKQEVQTIKSLLETWKTRPEIELEATFGFKGIVDQQTFLRVINRLRSKGYHAISQDDRLTIRLPDQLRFTLSGSGHIAQYCRDNTISDKPYIVIIKDRTITQAQEQSSNIDLKEYDVRIKARREIELSNDDSRVLESLQGWTKRRKYFRLIRRWSYSIPGLKFDLSMVRSTQRDKNGNEWQLLFNEQGRPLLSSLDPVYEIEVELDRSGFPEGSAPDAPFKTMIQGIGEVLRGIQGCPTLTRKSTKESVLKAYKELTGTDKFRGVAPITLELKNMTATPESGVPNIRSGYNVTDKADGLRVHGFTDESGELFMIDMAFNVFRTGFRNASCKNCLLDGEYVTHDKYKKPIQDLLFFDIYYHDKKDITGEPFKDANDTCRYNRMNSWIYSWNKDGLVKLLQTSTLHIGVKEFRFPEPGTTSIFLNGAATVLDRNESRNYYTDGLIFTPNASPLPGRPGVGFPEQLKWKPAEDNSIDFLVTTLKDSENKSIDQVSMTIHPKTFDTVRYKTLQLFVGSSEDPAYKDPRTTILNELPLPGTRIGERTRYRPVPFIPKEFADSKAAICHIQTQFDPKTNEEFIATEQNEPIRDRSIVEMRYDATQPPGWRWIPLRVRTDKTERLLKGRIERTLNSDKTAESIWNSIHEPVTLHMIRTGSEVPSQAEIEKFNITVGGATEKYFERKAPAEDLKKVGGLRKFHNAYVKDVLLYGSISAKPDQSVSLLDLTVGKAADIQRWRRSRLSFVLGTDIIEDNIRNTSDGAYRRLLDTLVENQGRSGSLPTPTMFFVTADSSHRLLDGSAGANEEERDILRSVLGRVEPIGTVPPAITKSGKGALAKGADVVTCMHSMHYFFESSLKFNGFLQNIADNLKIGGYYIGTNFDGGAVFDLLRGTDPGTSRAGMDGSTILWEIEKQYAAEELPNDDSVFGMAVNVFFISIGIKHKEYLIPWDFLVAKLKTIGCELVPAEELTALGLNASTNMYGTSYEMAMKTRDKQKFVMSDVVQQFSFLNRWYIFKRISKGSGQIGKLVGSVQEAVEDVEADEEVPSTEDGLDGLRTDVQDAATTRDLTAMTVPGSAAAASQMMAQIEEATQRGDREALKALNAQATGLQQQRAKELGLPVPPLVKGPPGSAAKTFVALEAAPAGPAALTVPIRKSGGGSDTFKASEVFQFYEKSEETSKYIVLPTKYASWAARHMSPNAPFRIRDTTDPSDKTEYPSITHFLAAMKFKYASKKPELATTVFGREGSIHMYYLAQRQAGQKGTNEGIPQSAHSQFVLDETTHVKTDEQKYMRAKLTEFDPTRWATVKDKLLREAVLQRLTNDKWFCTIVSTALAQHKYLLYFDKGSSDSGSELGGSRSVKGTIQGQNKYGKIITELAQTMPDEVKACLVLPDPF